MFEASRVFHPKDHVICKWSSNEKSLRYVSSWSYLASDTRGNAVGPLITSIFLLWAGAENLSAGQESSSIAFLTLNMFDRVSGSDARTKVIPMKNKRLLNRFIFFMQLKRWLKTGAALFHVEPCDMVEWLLHVFMMLIILNLVFLFVSF